MPDGCPASVERLVFSSHCRAPTLPHCRVADAELTSSERRVAAFELPLSGYRCRVFDLERASSGRQPDMSANGVMRATSKIQRVSSGH